LQAFDLAQTHNGHKRLERPFYRQQKPDKNWKFNKLATALSGTSTKQA
jgi:hypothetical protein